MHFANIKRKRSLRYFIELSYFGKAYHGWQNQPHSISVQEILEKNLRKLLHNGISIVGAGRTDAGVHAKQMFAHLDVENELDVEEIKYKLNSMLPGDIAIANVFRVQDNAHARFDAISRSYEYHIIRDKDAFEKDFAWLVRLPLDLKEMNRAAKTLLEYKDFKSFSRSRTDVKTYNCDISKAEWIEKNGKLVFHITADRFLRNMVRAVVGTLIEIGQGRHTADHMHEVIKSKDRGKAGASVPAHGLYLTRIEYPEKIRID